MEYHEFAEGMLRLAEEYGAISEAKMSVYWEQLNRFDVYRFNEAIWRWIGKNDKLPQSSNLIAEIRAIPIREQRRIGYEPLTTEYGVECLHAIDEYMGNRITEYEYLTRVYKIMMRHGRPVEEAWMVEKLEAYHTF